MDETAGITSGFIFHDSATFVTNMTRKGNATIKRSLGTDTAENFHDTYSASDDFFISIMNFDFGPSYKVKISEKVSFYTDLGLNITIMDADLQSNTLEYWGFGIFSDLALQFNLTTKMYLEIGINSIINIISSQTGSFANPYSPSQKINYEDTGKFDLVSVAPYIHIGRRLDLQKLKGQVTEKETELQKENEPTDE
jgi:hypothetical protein